MKNNAFFNGAITLVLFNLFGKVIGSLYRIMLASVLGGTGMGQYQLVFPLYNLMLTVSTSGIPVAISKMVAEFNEEKRFSDSRKLLKISLLILTSLSLVGAFVIVFFAKLISQIQGNPSAYICYYGIAPAVVFVGVLSALRGYFQGNLKMFPTAFSGLIEQVFKFGFGLFLAKYFLQYGLEYGVLGALISISISEFFACIFLLFWYIFSKKKTQPKGQFKSYSSKFLSKSLLSLSVPVTLGGLISPISSMIDSIMVVNLLMFTGLSSGMATSLLGIQSGVVEPLVNLPVTIAVSVAVVLLPSISKLKARSENVRIKSLISKAFAITLSLSVSCMVCYFVFGEQILELLYGRGFSPEEIFVATKLLFLSGLNIIFLSLVQISTSVLQGLGQPKYTVKSLFFGCLIKILLEAVLLVIPHVGIYGAAISGGVCYIFVFVRNFKKIKLLTGLKFENGYFWVSIQASLVAIIAFCANYALRLFVSSRLSLFLAGGVTALVFLITYYFFFFKDKNSMDKMQESADTDVFLGES